MIKEVKTVHVGFVAFHHDAHHKTLGFHVVSKEVVVNFGVDTVVDFRTETGSDVEGGIVHEAEIVVACGTDIGVESDGVAGVGLHSSVGIGVGFGVGFGVGIDVGTGELDVEVDIQGEFEVEVDTGVVIEAEVDIGSEIVGDVGVEDDIDVEIAVIVDVVAEIVVHTNGVVHFDVGIDLDPDVAVLVEVGNAFGSGVEVEVGVVVEIDRIGVGSAKSSRKQKIR